MKNLSELRQDIVSKEWVAIAIGRAKRPQEFSKQRKLVFSQSKKTCPFEDLHPQALLVYSSDGGLSKHGWWVQAVPNKYPAFVSKSDGKCGITRKLGPYVWTEGVGAHEVVITKDHERSIAQMSHMEAELLIRTYQDRYISLKHHPCVNYVSIFHNHGPQSGATISHPHSQIIALPIIPPDINSSLRGSVEHFHVSKECVHCVVIGYEIKAKERVIYENSDFVAIAPFASRTAFEIRIFPKAHSAYFEDISPAQQGTLADALRITLAKLKKGLNNPDYNFFIHTSPTGQDKEYRHYHWHLEILPKTAIWAGFEIGTGIDISTIAPESAAEFLKKIKV